MFLQSVDKRIHGFLPLFLVRNKRWREKKGSDFKKAESKRVEKIRKNRVTQTSATELKKYKMAAAERKRKSRMLKK